MPLTPSERHCSNCGRPMRVLDLSGHYQRRVEIDTCPHCCLVWFDDTESVRLAGPGIAEFVREIHGAMQADGEHAHAISLTRVQTCPVCQAALKAVANRTRFGRTTQLECPRGHGYYQTYILYLAEKGFVRPLAWSDIRSLLAAGKKLFCADCGYPLPARPVDACPACQSAIEVIDPSRLAMAIEHHGAKAEVAVAPAIDQHKCHACGGAIDVTRDIHCPHCHASVLRSDTAGAAQAALEAARRGAGRKPAAPHRMGNLERERSAPWQENFKFRLALGLLIGAIVLSIMAWYRRPEQRVNWSMQAAPLISYAPRFKEPDLQCDQHAAVRREVRIRQLIVAPGQPGPGPATATYGAMRAAYMRAAALRKEWESNNTFDLLEQQYNNPFAAPASMPEAFFRRGEALAAVERTAFCLPLHEISPPVLAEDGFHLIEVLEAR